MLTLLLWRWRPPQVRNVEEVSACSVVGIIGMVVSLVVIALKLCITPVADTYAPTEIVHK